MCSRVCCICPRLCFSAQAILPDPSPAISQSTRLSWQALSDSERAALDKEINEEDSLQESGLGLHAESEGLTLDSDDDEEAAASGRRYRTDASTSARTLEDDADELPVARKSLWPSLDDVPAHVPAFLPPFPGLQKQKTTADLARAAAKQADLQEDLLASSTAAAAAREQLAPKLHVNVHVDPWKQAIPFDRSSVAEQARASSSSERLPVPLPPQLSDQTEPLSSLPAFLSTHLDLTLNPPAAPDFNPNKSQYRRAAAAFLSASARAGEDSLFAAVPPLKIRFAKKTPGWLPYPLRLAPEDPDPTFMPFDGPPYNGTVVNSITFPVAASLMPLAPAPNPRLPNIFQPLIAPLADKQRAKLFARTTRMGQPGKLDESGQTTPYVLELDPVGFNPTDISHVQQGKGIQYGFDWRKADPTAKELPKSAALPSAVLKDLGSSSLRASSMMGMSPGPATPRDQRPDARESSAALSSRIRGTSVSFAPSPHARSTSISALNINGHAHSPSMPPPAALNRSFTIPEQGEDRIIAPSVPPEAERNFGTEGNINFAASQPNGVAEPTMDRSASAPAPILPDLSRTIVPSASPAIGQMTVAPAFKISLKDPRPTLNPNRSDSQVLQVRMNGTGHLNGVANGHNSVTPPLMPSPFGSAPGSAELRTAKRELDEEEAAGYEPHGYGNSPKRQRLELFDEQPPPLVRCSIGLCVSGLI